MNVAVLGLGFMGATHVRAWGAVPGARVAAVMSSDARKLAGDLTGVRGNLGGAGFTADFHGVRTYSTLADTLRDNEIDVVDICLPSNLHAAASLAALRAGRHVFLEKPLALNFADAERVVEEAAASGSAFMVGHVLRFFPAYMKLRRELAGAGAILSAVFRRNCAVPAWMDVSASGGAVFDLLIHDIDLCVSLWGLPQSVSATHLHYSGMGPVVIEGGWHDDPAYPFSMGYEIVCENRTLAWDSDAGNENETAADPFEEELKAFAVFVREGGPHPCPPDESMQAVMIAERMNDARCSKQFSM